MQNTDTNGKYVLITGASHGIGRALAMECGRRGFHQLLVALPDDLLAQTVKDIKETYGVKVHSLGTDITADDAIVRLKKWFDQLTVPLHFLINNAGCGTSGWFDEIPFEQYRNMLRLNNEALVMMAYTFLPELKKQQRSWLLNLGSLESFLPLPYKVVYTGTKQFNYGFTMALREELKNSGVSVSLLCPGPVPTHEEGLRRLESQGIKGKIMMKVPEYVARAGIKGTLNGRAVIIPGKLNQFSRRIGGILPLSWKMKILERVFRVYVEE